MRYKSAILLSAFFAALALSGVPASASAAAPPDSDDLAIVEVGTDAMGADSYSNRNREFVKFRNVSSASVDVKDVLIEDNWAHAKTKAEAAHTCNTHKIVDLPDNTGTEIAPGEYVTVFNGSRWGGNRKLVSGSVVEYQLFANSDRDCGTEGQYFNNNNDAVYVTTAKGVVLATFAWDHNGGYTFKP
jgi:hypothetical protein